MATLIKPGKAGEVKKGQRTTVKIVKTNPIKKKKQMVKKGNEAVKQQKIKPLPRTKLGQPLPFQKTPRTDKNRSK